MPPKPIPTAYFASAVVRHEDRFLLVAERKHPGQWYLPAGRVERGETLAEAAVRETLEEAGVRVRLIGLLRIEHRPGERRSRLRAVFLAEPVGDTTPKQFADKESLGARWVSLAELSEYKMRGPEVVELLRYVAAGGRVYPLDLVQEEGMPYRRSSASRAHDLSALRTSRRHRVVRLSGRKRVSFGVAGVVALVVALALAATGFALSGLWPGVSWGIGSALAVVSMYLGARWLRAAVTGRVDRRRVTAEHRGAV